MCFCLIVKSLIRGGAEGEQQRDATVVLSLFTQCNQITAQASKKCC